jgi:hypothetical protein
MKNTLGVIGALVVLGLILTYWKLLVGLTVLGLAVWGAYIGGSALLLKRRDRLNGEKAHRARLAARADHQHRQYLAGEDRGLYGEFKPADLD